jgi:hypothetical protein
LSKIDDSKKALLSTTTRNNFIYICKPEIKEPIEIFIKISEVYNRLRILCESKELTKIYTESIEDYNRILLNILIR